MAELHRFCIENSKTCTIYGHPKEVSLSYSYKSSQKGHSFMQFTWRR